MCLVTVWVFTKNVMIALDVQLFKKQMLWLTKSCNVPQKSICQLTNYKMLYIPLWQQRFHNLSVSGQ